MDERAWLEHLFAASKAAIGRLEAEPRPPVRLLADLNDYSATLLAKLAALDNDKPS